ncbi:MAG TPA: HAMP domain-containing sensor histidine kinase, partial [Nitrososphaeraceae archaeon]|nr:HAMP domain-containing sensor histidine kinase [Nitrososphaeraceae archaeon]
RSSEILYGAENAVGRGVQFMRNVKKNMDIYFDHRAPSIVVDIEEYRNGYINIRRRGAKIRAFTEITKENIHYCKQLMKMVDELRHLDGVKGGMAVSESEYMATTILEESKPLTEVIYSNVKEVVEQGQYIYDTLWRSAISAEQKIKEIEEGVTRYETRIIENPDEVIKEIGRLTVSSNKLDTCVTSGGLQYSHNYFFDLKKRLLDKQRRGEHKGIRYITNINNDNLHISKRYLEHGIPIRHMKNLPPMSFSVSDKEIAVTIEKMEGGRRIQSLLISNEPLYVRHFTSLFEEIWRNGIDGQHRIKQVEERVESDIEVIQNPDRTEELYWDIVKSAKKEILLILPTANAVIRQERMGIIKYLAEATKSRNVQVRILMPKVNLSHHHHHAIEESKPLQQQQDNPIDSLNVRYLQQLSDTKATILIADRKVSLVIEVRDDSKSTFYEAIGLSTYSNSKPGVLSYVSIFENLWIQTELYEQLKVHDKMQKDFINIAAHELRTPIQPILGLTEAVLSKSKDETQKELLEVVVRNAKRLRSLIENILDVTRIENQSLSLRKERLNINGIILNILEEYESRDNKKKDDVKIVFTPKDDFFVEADKGRVMQVISNLMNNAIKFTLKGTITVTTKKKEENNEIIVSIKDTGSGIDPEIMPRLFSKFATKSQTGTGLGLFVSQNIVEAHGGKIWAENNSDGRGCTFSFSLPLTNNNI